MTLSGYRDPGMELDMGESPQGSHGTGTGGLQTSWGASPQFSLTRGQPGAGKQVTFGSSQVHFPRFPTHTGPGRKGSRDLQTPPLRDPQTRGPLHAPKTTGGKQGLQRLGEGECVCPGETAQEPVRQTFGLKR